MSLLDPEDLAYMRSTQGEARPTPATLNDRTEVPDGMGGKTTGYGADVAVTIRVDDRDEQTPDTLVNQYRGNVVTITLDLVPIRSGDRITVSPTQVYEVVSDGDPDEWATAQQVYATRRTWPADA